MKQSIVPTSKLPELSWLQKFILTTDGTITPILEEYAQEELQVVKLSENICTNARDSNVLNIKPTDLILNRKILLQGKISQTNYLYAESSIVLNRLNPWLKEKLLDSNVPIGKLIIMNKIETFREILKYYHEPIGCLSGYFETDKPASFITRKYKIIVDSQPLFLIKEKIPANLYAA